MKNLKMNQIIEENYTVTVARGCIDSLTTDDEFFNKIEEELEELKLARLNYDLVNFNEELADIVMVCFNLAKHKGINIEQEIKNKIEINRQRI